MKSAGPKISVWIRGEAWAISADGQQAGGVLQLGLDADPADRQPDRLLDLGQQHVQPLDLRGALHLRQDDRVQVRAGALDHLDHVAVGPVRGQVVHPDRPQLVAPAALVQRRHDVLAGAGLGQRRAGVLQVEEDMVGGQPLGLLQEARVRARDGQAGAAGTQGGGLAIRSWLHTLPPTRWPPQPGVRGSQCGRPRGEWKANHARRGRPSTGSGFQTRAGPLSPGPAPRRAGRGARTTSTRPPTSNARPARGPGARDLVQPDAGDQRGARSLHQDRQADQGRAHRAEHQVEQAVPEQLRAERHRQDQ